MRNHVIALFAALSLGAVSSAQVLPDAGPNQSIAFGTNATLAGALNNRSPLDWWTADGNFATENCIVQYRDGGRLVASPQLHTPAGQLFGWPSDLLRIQGQIYGIESYHKYLYTVDVQTGTCTPIGPANAWPNVYSLAYDAAGDRLFGVDLLKKQLLRFDRQTGVVTKVGIQTLQGYYLIRALAYRHSDGFLYALDQDKSVLLRVDSLTGMPTVVRQFPKVATSRVEELEFYNDELYASLGILNLSGELVAGQLQKIDLLSGAVTNIGPIIQECSPHSLVINSVPEEFRWSVSSGPGTVTFSNPTSLTPSVTFSAAGNYVLALTAFATSGPVADTLSVTVN